MPLRVAASSSEPMPLFALTIFVSAFLLFLVQPIVAKQILPWFGGSAAVWTTCLVFFQTDAAAGYAYADLAVRRLAPRAQVRLHWRCSIVSLVAAADHSRRVLEAGRRRESRLAHPRPARRDDRAPVLPAVDDEPAGAGLVRAPLSRRAIPIGSSRCRTSPRCSRCSAIRSCSSRGSPRARRRGHGRSATSLFVVLARRPAWRSLQGGAQPARLERGTACSAPPRRGRRRVRPTPARQLLWCALAATGSVLLLGRQQPHHAERRVGAAAVDPAAHALPAHVHPLLRRHGLVQARHRARDAVGGAGRDGVDARRSRTSPTSSQIQVGVFCVGLFLACMFCHGELVRLKPAPDYLTRFYLMISLGGARRCRRSSASSRRSCCRPTSSSPARSSLCALLLLWQVRRELAGVRGPAAGRRCARPIGCARGAMTEFYRRRDRRLAQLLRRAARAGSRRRRDGQRRQLIHGNILHGKQYLDADLAHAADDATTPPTPASAG